jgi:succinoglycan biosynthesis transport protein ExoP
MFGLKNEDGLVTAMTKVLSQEISNGSLNEYSVDDLFFLAALKRLSGNLTVANDSQAITVFFENGRLLHLQNQKNPLTNRLGTILVRGGVLSEEQLEEALDLNQRTGQPLGYILINAGYLTQEQLQGPLKLQMEEHLQKLFSWKHGTFAFEPMSIKTYEDEKIYFGEDYIPIIRRLGRMAGSRFLEAGILSHIMPINEPNAWLLPSGITQIKPNSPAYIMLFSKFLDILKRHFDIILVDAPPFLDSPDASHLSSLGDGVIFVIKAGNLSDRAINMATTKLKEAGANILGVVLNQAKLNKEYYL